MRITANWRNWWQRPSDFNKDNHEFVELEGVHQIGGRFLNKARNKWFIYRIAAEFHISPREVEQWDYEQLMETLAAVNLMNKKPTTPT